MRSAVESAHPQVRQHNFIWCSKRTQFNVFEFLSLVRLSEVQQLDTRRRRLGQGLQVCAAGEGERSGHQGVGAAGHWQRHGEAVRLCGRWRRLR